MVFIQLFYFMTMFTVFLNMGLLAVVPAHWHPLHPAVEVCTFAAHDAPAKFSRFLLLLVLDFEGQQFEGVQVLWDY